MLLKRHDYTDMRGPITLDHEDRAYIATMVVWTVILFSAMCFLWRHRQLPQLQMRRLPLVFVAMVSLHIYSTIVMVAYILGPAYPCVLEYWVMSILLPFGIAMFQLANSQFLWIATQQRRYMSISSLEELQMQKKISVLDGYTGTFCQRMRKRAGHINPITKLVICVAIAMTVQVALTCIIFLLSRKFHSNFGIFPANLFGSATEQRSNCIRGWEWWLSMVWQFFWAWIYAPYILWKSRDIKDTHGWRLQTVLCCVAGLPCSPLWLCGLYLPQFSQINANWIPPMWFAVSIFLITVFTIFIPCYQVYKSHHLRSETLAVIAAWEAKPRQSSSSVTSESTVIGSMAEQAYVKGDDQDKDFVYARAVNAEHENEDGAEKTGKESIAPSKVFRGSEILSMDALEHALDARADALQIFAALRDFSGENVSFLTHLIMWKKVWARHDQEREMLEFSDPQDQERVDEVRQRDHFNRAVSLYATFVSRKLATFPISISTPVSRQLDSIFAGPAESLFGARMQEAAEAADIEHNHTRLLSDAQTAGRGNSTASILKLDEVWYWDDIPAGFNVRCFDEAEREIKHFVLTETWPRFVTAEYEGENRKAEGDMLAKRLSTFFSRL